MKRQRRIEIDDFQELWLCPITGMPMKNPVILQDGYSYEQKNIIEYLQKNKISPKTGLRLKKVQVVPNITLKKVIQKFQTQIKYSINNIKQKDEQNLRKMNKYRDELEVSKASYQILQKQSNEIKQRLNQIYEKFTQASKIYDNLDKQYQIIKKSYNKLKNQHSNSNIKSENNIKNTFQSNQNNKLKIQSKKQQQIKKINQTILHLRQENQQLKQTLNQKGQAMKKNFQLKKVVSQKNSQINTLNQEKNKLVEIIENFKLKIPSSEYKDIFFQTQILKIKDSRVQRERQRMKNIKVQVQKTHKIQSLQDQVTMFSSLNIHLHDSIIELKGKISNLKCQKQDLQNKLNNQKRQRFETISKLKTLDETLKKQKESQKKQKLQTSIQQSKMKQSQNLDKMEQQNNNCLNKLTNAIKQNQNVNPQISSIDNLLPFEQYLKNYSVQYHSSSCQLNHSRTKVIMEEFLKYDWQKVTCLKLINCQIQNKGFQIFVNHAYRFPNLRILYLNNNNITDLPDQCFDKFYNLRHIYFGIIQRNSFNKKSLKYLDDMDNRN